ncbi:M28 family peptidase [Denitrobaculum tricleocarpae]|uniref:M28 family peptidase n=1 Tax=Denitrobaculum tricleocarpae TaxID=2591009 RepID=A0A545TPR6_9PROT|nr:M28 family peptidase [Denitrobaculum tricleocarpae]TQV79178.1 M28 family peptidase [Denitrobaculum tricleocarpae]
MTTSEPQTYAEQCAQVMAHLTRLSVDIHDRSAGCAGNRAATDYVAAVLTAQGWSVATESFDALDWHEGGATLTAEDGVEFGVFASPYALGCEIHAVLAAVATVEELEAAAPARKLLLLHGEIARQSLMPKNFPFYSDDAHQRIIASLEACDAAAIITATARKGGAAGDGSYPTPMIEDGDFDIPSVFTTGEEGERLLQRAGEPLTLVSQGSRVASRAANVIARINERAPRRIVVTAHIDAKKSIPGALDNATGIATLLLLGELLAGYKGRFCIELVALNGEDHYAVPGQVAYMAANRGLFDTIALNINVDGVGYLEGDTAFSLFGLPDGMAASASQELLASEGACAGSPWVQGDHSMFLQAGRPAIAITSDWLLQNMATQTVTHTSQDTIDLVAPQKLVSCALSVRRFIDALS